MEKSDRQDIVVRLTRPEDTPGLKSVVDSTGLFPSDMLPDMLRGFLEDASNSDVWLTATSNGETVGFCYTVPEELTDGTWNMLAIGVLPSKQGGGIGRALVSHLQDLLRDRGERILLAETSGTGEFAQTRAFYRTNGYTEEARIRDFWAAGDDKIVFWKALAE